VGSNYVDPAGHHLLSQCCAGGERTTTHDAIAQEIVHMVRAGNNSARREDRQIILENDPNSKQRMDVIIDNFEDGSSLSIDVSIVDCRNVQYARNAELLPGQAAKDRENYKIKKYGSVYANLGYTFKPFVVESFGRFGDRTAKLFDELALRVHAARPHIPLAYHKHFWRTRIIMAMHRNAALGVKKRMDNVLRRRNGLEGSTGGKSLCLPCEKVDMWGYTRCRG